MLSLRKEHVKINLLMKSVDMWEIWSMGFPAGNLRLVKFKDIYEVTICIYMILVFVKWTEK